MNKWTFWVVTMGVVLTAVMLCPEPLMAQYGGAFESKVNTLTHSIINFLLPAASVLGLVYASILAAQGDAEAKQRMVLIAVASIVGFLAPFLISWLKGISGS